MKISTQPPVRIPLDAASPQQAQGRAVFRLETDAQLHSKAALFGEEARSAGTMPVWGQPRSMAEEIAAQAGMSADPATQSPYAAALLPNDAAATAQADNATEKPFGFGDLVDMVNPLQHIPLVNIAYREITGDQIRPIGKIIGGTLFAGPIGAGTALVDVGVEAETGRDIGQHLVGSLSAEKSTQAVSSQDTTLADNADTAAAMAFAGTPAQPPSSAPYSVLEGTTLALADLGGRGDGRRAAAETARPASRFVSFTLNG